MRVEHDALLVDLGVPRPDPVDERHRRRPGFVRPAARRRGPATTASIARLAEPRRSRSRSGCGPGPGSAARTRGCGGPVRARRSGTRRSTRTASSRSPAAVAQRRLDVRRGHRRPGARTRGRCSRPGTGERPEGAVATGAAEQPVDVELERDRAGRDPEASSTAPASVPTWPTGDAVDGHRRRCGPGRSRARGPRRGGGRPARAPPPAARARRRRRTRRPGGPASIGLRRDGPR